MMKLKQAFAEYGQFFRRHSALVVYIVTTQAWLLGPALNHHLSFSKAYVSDLFMPTQPWSWFFRLLEIISGIALIVASYQKHYRKHQRNFSKHQSAIALWMIRVLGFLTVIDGIFIDNCPSDVLECSAHGTTLLINIVHGIESILCVVILLLLAVWLVRRVNRTKQLAVLIFACLIVLLIMQLAGPYSPIGKGLWQRLFIVVSCIPVGIALLV